MNVQARELELGSGGFDILHANLTRGLELEPEPGAHVMTLPYTSLQHAVRHGEEDALARVARRDCRSSAARCTRRSCPCVRRSPGSSVAYVQVAGGALPVSLSDAVRALRARRLLAFTVAAAPCVDADVQAVNVYSALAYAATRAVPTRSCARSAPASSARARPLGHGGLAAAQAVNAAAALGGRPVLAPRVSGADAARASPWPLASHRRGAAACASRSRSSRPSSSRPGWREACEGLPLSHMGRGPTTTPSSSRPRLRRAVLREASCA